MTLFHKTIFIFVSNNNNKSRKSGVKSRGKNNNKNDDGIKVTWLFAHPDNKKVTGPYERFRIMIYGQQYRQLLNHESHKINLIMNTPNTHMYKIKILTITN